MISVAIALEWFWLGVAFGGLAFSDDTANSVLILPAVVTLIFILVAAGKGIGLF